MKPLIGILSLFDETRDSYWMLPGYVEGIEEGGGSAVILPYPEDPEILDRYIQVCDGFLLPGGQDVDPDFYGQEKTELCGVLCPQRDKTERQFFSLILDSGKPVLGICRGFQAMNALLGGELYQDIPTQAPSAVEHHETPPYDKVAHMVSLQEDTPLHKAVQLSEMGVNSYHHQGVKTLGKGLAPAATAPDGLVEALYLPGHRFFLGVQWHPEFSHKSDENSRKIFAAFVNACRE